MGSPAVARLIGARQGQGAQVELLQVAETLPKEVLEKMGAAGVVDLVRLVLLADPRATRPEPSPVAQQVRETPVARLRFEG